MSLAPFAVWAPKPDSVSLMLRRVGQDETTEIAMTRDGEGWWQPEKPLPEGSVDDFDYGYRLDGADVVLADPRSRRQPDGRARLVARL